MNSPVTDRVLKTPHKTKHNCFVELNKLYITLLLWSHSYAALLTWPVTIKQLLTISQSYYLSADGLSSADDTFAFDHLSHMLNYAGEAGNAGKAGNGRQWLGPTVVARLPLTG